MRRLRRRMTAVLTALLLLTLLIPWGLAEPAPGPHQTTVLFTHDLHSHFLPLERADGGESGGYARLASALEQQRALHPDALTLDGGDFSIGSLVQTLYTTRAAELRTMGALGYDATTAGNHEFDHTGLGFAQMLTAAYTSGDPLPALLMANYAPSAGGPDQLDIQRAMSAYGVTDTLLLERGGVTYGIFGLMGTDSDDCAPTSGFTLEDPVQAAQRCVDSLEEQGAQFIIALSHSGTDERERKSEDQQLAREVEGIDLILSGHTHTTLTQPIVEGDTYIVSAGPYSENLGSITLEWSEDGSKTLVDYQLIPIDQTLPEDQEIASLVEEWKAQVGLSGGFRSKDIVILEEEMGRAATDLYICTDDGSYGYHGFVTGKLEELIQGGAQYDHVVAIGPLMMMKFACKLTEKYHIPTTVSMNPIMIDGTGMCGCCRVTVGGEVKFACVDGPDFDGHQVDFDEVIARNATYREFEARRKQDHLCRLGGGAMNG